MDILGVSLSHDSGVTLVRDGQLHLAVNEERFSRSKSFAGFPALSLAWIRDQLGGSLQRIAHVGAANIVQGEPPPVRSDISDANLEPWQWAVLRAAMATGADRPLLGTDVGVKLLRSISRHFIGRPYRAMTAALHAAGCTAPIVCVDHHTCHLLSAIYTAGHDTCLAISADGFGDAVAGAIGTFRDGEFRLLSTTPMYHSLGNYYLFATSLCGFPKIYHCGKTTGLAAYGQGGRALDYFRRNITFDPARGRIINRGRSLYRCLEEMRRELAGVPREDIAAGIQTVTEEVTTALVRYWMKTTGIGTVVLAGGLFANVKLNQRIAALPEVRSIFVHPHMGDGGLNTGAAYAAMRHFQPRRAWAKPYRLPHVFLGSPVSASPVRELIRQSGLQAREPADIDTEIAGLLAQGKVVARVAGPMEYGPRALGNRSILYAATDPTVNTWLNHKLRRSEFMPFAPMVLQENAPLLFKWYAPQNEHTAEFMTITYDVTDRCKRESPAVVHVDGTARPQVITPAANPHCYRILQEYQRRTGLLAIINTSYNLHDEPIVRTAEDAIRVFRLSELDYLVLDNYLVWKQP